MLAKTIRHNFLVNFQDFETYFGFQIAVTLYVNRFWLKRGENDQIVPISSQIVPRFQLKTRCEGIHMSNVCFCRGLKTDSWKVLLVLWNDVAIKWNDLAWNDLTMERSDRIQSIRLRVELL